MFNAGNYGRELCLNRMFFGLSMTIRWDLPLIP